jgi:hypothetical protein
VSDRIWLPNRENDMHSGGIRAMHGGPIAMRIPEHAHVETQVQVRFRKLTKRSICVNASEKRSHYGRCWSWPVIHQSPLARTQYEL